MLATRGGDGGRADRLRLPGDAGPATSGFAFTAAVPALRRRGCGPVAAQLRGVGDLAIRLPALLGFERERMPSWHFDGTWKSRGSASSLNQGPAHGARPQWHEDPRARDAELSVHDPPDGEAALRSSASARRSPRSTMSSYPQVRESLGHLAAPRRRNIEALSSPWEANGEQ